MTAAPPGPEVVVPTRPAPTRPGVLTDLSVAAGPGVITNLSVAPRPGVLADLAMAAGPEVVLPARLTLVIAGLTGPAPRLSRRDRPRRHRTGREAATPTGPRATARRDAPRVLPRPRNHSRVARHRPGPPRNRGRAHATAPRHHRRRDTGRSPHRPGTRPNPTGRPALVSGAAGPLAALGRNASSGSSAVLWPTRAAAAGSGAVLVRARIVGATAEAGPRPRSRTTRRRRTRRRSPEAARLVGVRAVAA
ncbi:hypothetical protein AB0J83_50325 [Actinoplanes sp. NPDC049596]|uniref:hypothetical protein n=1 Tax=Actinoplanes sp. NPDC049596 TaxID=3154625 RepID=UPI0034303FF1